MYVSPQIADIFFLAYLLPILPRYININKGNEREYKLIDVLVYLIKITLKRDNAVLS